MPEMPLINASTFCVSTSVCGSVEFSGIVIETGNSGLEDWSSRFTRRRGMSAIEPAKTSPAAPSASQRWTVAQRTTGT